jgi:chaperonin cofactor prefoldin
MKKLPASEVAKRCNDIRLRIIKLQKQYEATQSRCQHTWEEISNDPCGDNGYWCPSCESFRKTKP